jgi:hypothetical protein
MNNEQRERFIAEANREAVLDAMREYNGEKSADAIIAELIREGYTEARAWELAAEIMSK